MTGTADASGEPHVGPLVADEHIPPWLRRLAGDVTAVADTVRNRGGDRSRWVTTPSGNRRAAAVLVLFGGDAQPDPDYPGGLPFDADVLLTERAATLRQHSGQVAFPGGAFDSGENYPVGTALREAAEETGLSSTGVDVIATLPSCAVPVSGFDVRPVIAHWREPSPVRVMDPGETSRVVRVNLRSLLSPENRFQVRRSVAGAKTYQGPAFFVDGLLVWGFTGGLLAAMSAAAGWDVPWDVSDVRPLDEMIERAGSAQLGGFTPEPGGDR
ncbi:MAG: CoA pyrophosphatase [Gordonia sp. (in: high G+C Gram-positive bacteria)]